MMDDQFEVRRGKTNFQFSTFDFQSKNRKAEAEFSLLPFLRFFVIIFFLLNLYKKRSKIFNAHNPLKIFTFPL